MVAPFTHVFPVETKRRLSITWYNRSLGLYVHWQQGGGRRSALFLLLAMPGDLVLARECCAFCVLFVSGFQRHGGVWWGAQCSGGGAGVLCVAGSAGGGGVVLFSV